jgi:hypothetical protein
MSLSKLIIVTRDKEGASELRWSTRKCPFH